MQLSIRQRMFSWTDSYDVFDETGAARYQVKTEFFSFGHQIHVYDRRTGREVGSVHEKLLSFLPRFEIVLDGRVQGSVRKELSFLRPRYNVDFRGWEAEGDFLGWDYRVMSGRRRVMTITKALLHWTDSYVLHYEDPADELPGLMLVIAIDAANCSDNK